jgi:hypothetical protein
MQHVLVLHDLPITSRSTVRELYTELAPSVRMASCRYQTNNDTNACFVYNVPLVQCLLYSCMELHVSRVTSQEKLRFLHFCGQKLLVGNITGSSMYTAARKQPFWYGQYKSDCPSELKRSHSGVGRHFAVRRGSS